MDRDTRIEENEKLFREVNERVAQMHSDLSPGHDTHWVCECGDETCFEKLPVSLPEYHEVREHQAWFFVKPGHEKRDVERVIRERRTFVVVEKDGLL